MPFEERPTTRSMADDLESLNQAPEHPVPLPPVQPPERLRLRVIETKLAGSTFASKTPDGDSVGQKALRHIKLVGRSGFEGNRPTYRLSLLWDRVNAHDPDAVRVIMHTALPGVEDIRIGYLPNAPRKCTRCGAEYAPTFKAKDSVTRCTGCGAPTRPQWCGLRGFPERFAAR